MSKGLGLIQRAILGYLARGRPCKRLPFPERSTRRALARLAEGHLVVRRRDGAWTITAAGEIEIKGRELPGSIKRGRDGGLVLAAAPKKPPRRVAAVAVPGQGIARRAVVYEAGECALYRRQEIERKAAERDHDMLLKVTAAFLNRLEARKTRDGLMLKGVRVLAGTGDDWLAALRGKSGSK